jgi:hypothetical protein
VETILEIWFDYVAENGYAWRMLFRDAGGDEEIRAFRRANFDRAREVLASFIRTQKGIPKGQVEPLAEFLRAGGAGLARCGRSTTPRYRGRRWSPRPSGRTRRRSG